MPEINAAIVREKSGPFTIERVTLDEPRDDEVLVRIAGVGVCHTDIVVRNQYFPTPLPAVLGHEGSGVVEKVGARVTSVESGDHVILSYASCGKCENCRNGKIGYCPDLYGHNFSGGRPDGSSPCCGANGERLSGYFFAQSSFGEMALANESNVVKIRKDVPIELMGPLGCGIQTGAGAVMNALNPPGGSTIAIFGAGSVGLAAVLAARLVGCEKIIVVDINEKRLELSRDCGATHIVNSANANPVETIQDLTAGEGVQYSLECTGIPEVVRQAVDSLRLTGICGVIGVAPLGTEFSLDMNAILFGRSVRGIIEGDAIPQVFIPRLVDLYFEGRFPFDKLVEIYPFEKINEAIEDSEKGKVLKAVLRP
jgi:aryl-alcohol dehydrogenase